MFSMRTSILALAAVASIGAALATSTTSADARPGFGGFRGGFHGGFHGRVARFTPDRPQRPHWHPRWPRPNWHVRWHRPWVYGAGVAAVAAPAYAAARPAAGPCTCLTKEYTPDNLVVFKDQCTKEMAAAPVGGQQQQSMVAPQPGETAPMPPK